MKKKSFDAVVLGGGIAGLGAASALARAGKKILVLEKRGVRGQATSASAGILDPFLEMERTHPLFKLNREAFQKYPAWIKRLRERTGMDPGYQETGMLFAALTPQDLKEIQRRYAWQKTTGIPVKIKSAAEIRRQEPSLNAKVLAGLEYPTVARLQPRHLMRVVEAYARSYGVEFLESSGHFRVKRSGGKVTGLLNGECDYEAPVIINAMGSWAGVTPLASLRVPVSPARGQIEVVKSTIKISSILHTFDGGYVVPWDSMPPRKAAAPKQYLLGSTVEFAGFKPVTTAEGIHSIRRRAEMLVPGLSEAKKIERWSGLRPFSRLSKPLIGPTRIPGYYLALGYYRSGILIGALAGELLAEAVISGKIPALIKDFDPREIL